MRTDELVTLLATGVEPVARQAFARRYAAALLLGLLAAAALMLACLGLNEGLARVARLPMFWVKLGFPALLATAGLFACARLTRPGARLAAVPGAVAAPFVALWLLAATALLAAAPEERAALLLGNTWRVCPLIIAGLALPALAAILRAMQGLAPTRLRLAGAAGGLLAGAIGALVYALHCAELAAPFIGTWYALGMLLPAALGALVAPRVLAW